MEIELAELNSTRERLLQLGETVDSFFREHSPSDIIDELNCILRDSIARKREKDDPLNPIDMSNRMYTVSEVSRLVNELYEIRTIRNLDIDSIAVVKGLLNEQKTVAV